MISKNRIIYVIINCFILFCLFAGSGLCVEPLYGYPYIIVYGRDACGRTRHFIQELDKSRIAYTYKIIDEPTVDAELIPRMKKAGIDTSQFGLPVIDVNGNICVNPQLDTVLGYYQKPVKKSSQENSFFKSFFKKKSRQKEYKKKTYNPGSLEVSGVITGEDPIAIVDGKTLSIGDKIADYELISIEAGSVSFRSPEGETISKKVP
ncbi:MAG: hypothetical protein JW867_02240 [Candidatus Omnitrophica bacterium]|nr:hypothetical protein [Candidatus Omnitrophota bacterium]